VACHSNTYKDKYRVDDWEINRLIVKGYSGALVTIVDRATSFTFSKRVNSQSAKDVTVATISLLKPYTLLTVTMDNSRLKGRLYDWPQHELEETLSWMLNTTKSD